MNEKAPTVMNLQQCETCHELRPWKVLIRRDACFEFLCLVCFCDLAEAAMKTFLRDAAATIEGAETQA